MLHANAACAACVGRKGCAVCCACFACVVSRHLVPGKAVASGGCDFVSVPVCLCQCVFW
jgi:hypothetical protein